MSSISYDESERLERSRKSKIYKEMLDEQVRYKNYAN